MEKPYCDEPENPIKIEIPELVVEWQESEITYESNTLDLYVDPEQIPNNFIPLVKFYKWKKDGVHITIIGIILSIFLMLGFLWYDIYEPLKSKSVLNSLENIYSYRIKKDNNSVCIILDEDANVLYEKIANENSTYQDDILSQKIYWYLTENNKLFYLTSKGSQMVTDNVIEFLPSSDGLKVYYIVNQDDSSSLYEYKLESGTSILIDNNVVERDFCISPDSKVLAYQRKTTEDNVTETYFYSQGKKQLKATNVIPVALSNEGALFYYVQNENLFVQSDGVENQLIKVPNNDLSNLELFFNQNHTELQYTEYQYPNNIYPNYIYPNYKYLINKFLAAQSPLNRDWYISTNGKTGVKLKEYEIFDISLYLKYGGYINHWYNHTYTSNITHLTEILTFTKSLKCRELLDTTLYYSYGLISDNKLFCLADGSVYFMEYQADNPDKIIKISEDLCVKQLVTSVDNSFCYMLTVEGNLYQYDLNGNLKWRLDHVAEIIQIYLRGKEEFCFARINPQGPDLSSVSIYQLCYRKDDNTIVNVEGAGYIKIENSQGRLQDRLLYRDAMDDNQYYMLKNGKGIKVNFPLSSEN
ncbi:hypothetical protein [Lachnoclostridium phytofermentans]|uniref:Uncharacterized protein n=1 Tax=Lachnoclostridium phytofermentans (strain ATCC 700394 / DSM 18823 / ISDg) TaxID=357809 RepID=A9KIK6_LACP7|nr:hypothetical protein [Lachnoclostridium phytofermentans]ABX42458.1 hypothetical protein Cphy_2090 [Lachnoclostridium phytofermentans ISDg]